MDTMDDNNFDRIRMIDFLVFFVENIYWYSQSLARTFTVVARRFFENVQVAELVDTISDKFSEHPVLKYMALATALSCALPVLMFLIFGIISVAVTFTGFLFIEGTLLAIGGLTMFFTIMTLMLVMTVLAVTLSVLYILVLKLGVLLNKFESTSHLMRNLAPPFVEREVFQISNSIAATHQD